MEKSRARDPLQRLSADPSRHKKEIHKSRYKTDPCQVILTGDFFRSFGFRPGRRGN